MKAHGHCGFRGCWRVATHRKMARVRNDSFDGNIRFVHRCSVHADDSYVEIKPTVDRSTG